MHPHKPTPRANPDPRDTALQPPKENPPEVTQAFEQLAIEMRQLPKLPESVFVQHLLPILVAAGEQKRVDLTRWLDIAGTPQRAIEVVDDNTGEQLFILPPLMRSLPTVFQEELIYSNIVGGSLQRTDVHPMVGQNFLADALRRVQLGVKGPDLESLKNWNSIRARYNLPPIGGEAAVKLGAAPASAGGEGNLSSMFDDQDY
ncbi:hypothetical protein LUCX_69 [Xanthomonas phage vB_XciM_LucasX]|nr:hypothetical protein LUCX_69 [Xanthomonas phage vB_XciM_LucasX]